MNKWFTSISAFKIKEEINLSEKEILEKLKENKIIECDKFSLETIGWDLVLPEQDEESYLVKISGAFFVNLKKETKLIPSSVVKAETEKEINARFKKTGEKLSKAEKRDIKEGILAKMKSQAFVKPSNTFGYIDIKNNKIIVGTSSPKVAEEFLSLLRKSFGTLSVEILNPEYNLSEKLTSVLLNIDKFPKFKLSSDCKLKDLGDNSTITAKDEDLSSNEIKEHILSGKQVDTLSLIWENRILFKVNSKFKIQSIKPLEIIKEQMTDDLGDSLDDERELFIADKMIMIEDFNEMLDDLISM